MVLYPNKLPESERVCSGICSVLSDFPVQVFNEICGIDYFSDFQRELEENSQIIPVVSP